MASLTIGALASATGIPVETLRTWERRYGYPEAARKPSGHRVYPLTTVARLRRVAQAMALGHRAAQVVAATDQTLDLLLAAAGGPSAGSPRHAAQVASVAELVKAVAVFDTDSLRRMFQADWAHLGPLDFLEQRAAPLMAAIGAQWVEGGLDIRHEHVASASLGDFLRTARFPHDEVARGPSVALATLDGELHGLGLQMCATIFALAGWRSLVVGVSTPLDELAALAVEANVAAVAVSLVQPPSDDTAETIASLRHRLPAHIPVLLGGSGVPVQLHLKGVHVLGGLRALDDWARARVGR